MPGHFGAQNGKALPPSGDEHVPRNTLSIGQPVSVVIVLLLLLSWLCLSFFCKWNVTPTSSIIITMGFFIRSKKPKKESPKPPVKTQRQLPAQSRRPPPPPPSTQGSQHGHNGSLSQAQGPFQPAGLLPPPPGWNGAPPPYQSLPPSPPIIVNQHHYYLGPPPSSSQTSQPPRTSCGSLSKLNLGSAVDMAKELCQETGIQKLFGDALPSLNGCGNQLIRQTDVLMDQISTQFNDVLTLIDRENYNGREKEILTWQPPQAQQQQQQLIRRPISTPSSSDRSLPKAPKKAPKKDHPKGQTTAAATAVSSSIFAKVDLYANSRLPLNLPPLKL